MSIKSRALSLVKGNFRDAFSIDWNNTGESIGGGGIDAVDQTKKRRTPGGKVRHLDDEIKDGKRQKITLTSRNVTRNFEIAAWAIRKHLDFVSKFTFAMRTNDKGFNSQVEDFVKWWSRPINFDVSGRHSLRKSIRMAEAMRCIDGDFEFLKIRTGQIQGIEGDRIKTPDKRKNIAPFNEELTYNGVELSKDGRPKRYAVHARTRDGGLEFQKWILSKNLFVHGFYDRWDQVRGVSPLVAALNRYQDVYENFDYALARAKVAQLFGLVFFRDATENSMGTVSGEDTDGDGVNDTHSVKLGTRPMIFDLDPGEDAKFLENKTPAPEFQQFTNSMIGVALKSLDIPFSFYDEAYTNFFGSKAALTLYLQSARDKREDVQELLRQLTIWRLRLAIEDGDIVLPRGIETMEDIAFEWTPAGVPWLDPRDVNGDVTANKAGYKTKEMICRDRFGLSWKDDILPELIEEQKLIEENNLNVTLENPPNIVVDADEVVEQIGTEKQ